MSAAPPQPTYGSARVTCLVTRPGPASGDMRADGRPVSLPHGAQHGPAVHECHGQRDTCTQAFHPDPEPGAERVQSSGAWGDPGVCTPCARVWGACLIITPVAPSGSYS